MLGTLYIVATPIGNLEDITLRAINILKQVDLILAEDTRKTNLLLKHFEITTNTFSYHQQSHPSKKQDILNHLIQGKNIALVTDAGTPGISDPGNELIDFLLSQVPDLSIVPIPGASSLTAAISVSGFRTDNFLFLGFWPKKKTQKLIQKIEEVDCTTVFFDSPFRIIKTLTLLNNHFPTKRILVAQEITKIHERVLRGTLSDVIIKLQQEQRELGRVKGELVCILES